MPVSVVMPALEMAQETGKVVRWLKKEGEQVAKGEMLIEVETDKAVVEVEALAAGLLAGVAAQEGDVVPVGRTIAWLLQPGESVPQADASATVQTGRRTDGAGAAPTTAAPSAAASAPGGRVRVSPKARKMAADLGIDLATLTGSGAGGEILADDILKASQAGKAGGQASPSTAAPASHTLLAQSSIGKIMAERTTQSWTSVPHFFVTREVDASALNAARAKQLPSVEQSHKVKLTHTDLIVSAVAAALRKHPRMNASWDNGGIRANADINIALAMAVENAVVTAVVRNADKASPGELAARRRELADRASANKLQPADITAATFTISNLGMFAVNAFTAIIVPPQAGILAVGAIADRVVAVDGKPVVRPMMSITLSSDHRVIDGAGAAAFLNDVVTALQAL